MIVHDTRNANAFALNAAINRRTIVINVCSASGDRLMIYILLAGLWCLSTTLYFQSDTLPCHWAVFVIGCWYSIEHRNRHSVHSTTNNEIVIWRNYFRKIFRFATFLWCWFTRIVPLTSKEWLQCPWDILLTALWRNWWIFKIN